MASHNLNQTLSHFYDLGNQPVVLAHQLLAGQIVATAQDVSETDIRSRAFERASSMDGDMVERGFNPQIKVAGLVAMVWLPYDFYVDGNWSHCGVDVFTLIKTEGGWRIVSTTYSVEQPPACQPHPDGPPK